MSKYIAIVTIMISTAFVAFNFQNCAKSSFQLRDALDSNGVTGLTAFPTSCREYYENGSCQDGVYKVDPDGNGIGMEPFDVYCDMTNYGRTLLINAPEANYTNIPELQEVKSMTTLGRLPDSKIAIFLNLTQNSQHNNVVVDLATGQDNHTVSLNSNSTSTQGQYVIMDTANDLCDAYDTGVDGAAYTQGNYWQFGNGSGDGFIGYLDNQTGNNPYTGFTVELPTGTDKACNMVGPKQAATYLKGSMWIVEDPNPHSACEQPPTAVNGGWTDWAPWTDSTTCDSDCNKTQSSVRTCTNPEPANGGSDCSLLDGGNAIKYQTTSCQPGEGQCTAPPQPVDGNWTTWSGWTDTNTCDVYCNKTQSSTRTCTNPTPVYGGNDCSGLDGGNSSKVQIVQCQPGEGLCAPLPIHGGWTSWSGWVDDGQCDASCLKPQKRTRECTNPTPQNGGNDCAQLDGGNDTDTKVASCQDGEGLCNANPPIDGNWTAWSLFAPHTPCTADCTKEVIQVRTCTNPAPMNGGKDCSDLDGGNAQNIEVRNCQYGEGLCQPDPIDGGYTPWTSWTPVGQCDQYCKQHFSSSRSCTNPLPQFGGKDCSALGDSIKSYVKDCDVGEGLCNGLAKVIILGTNPENFGELNPGNAGERVITYKNVGGLVATNLQLSGLDNPFDFKGGNPPDGSDGSCQQGGSLQPNSVCTVTVSFVETTPGEYDDTLVLDYNDGQEDGQLTRDLVAKVKDGVAPGELNVTLIGPGDFGTTPPGSPVHLIVKVKNEGSLPAANLDVPAINEMFYLRNGNDPSAPGTFPGTGGTCDEKLAVGAECTIALTYNPPEKGTHTATLNLTYTSDTTDAIPQAGTSQLPLIGRADENCPTCPIDGQWSPWTSWTKKGECGPDCKKLSKRYRQCNNPAPQNGGKDCEGPAEESKNETCQPGEDFCPLLAKLEIDGNKQFGTLTVGETSPNHTFTVKNVGGRDATNVQPYVVQTLLPTYFNLVGGTCDTVNTLAPAETCTLVYNYKPEASGTHQLEIGATYNDGQDDLEVKTTIVGSANDKPAALEIVGNGDFGEQEVNGSTKRTFTLRNIGQRPATNIKYNGVELPFTRSGGNCTATLNVGQSCTLIYTYSSPVPGDDKDILEIPYSDGVASQQITQMLNGKTKVDPADIKMVCIPKNVGSVPVGQKKTVTCTLSNVGGAPGSGFTLAPLGAPWAHTGGSCAAGTVLAPKAQKDPLPKPMVRTCNYVFTFAPTQPGDYPGVVNITYNNGDGNSTVADTLNGSSPKLAPAKLTFNGVYNFGNLTLGTDPAKVHTFTVKNVGGSTATDLKLTDVNEPFKVVGGTCKSTLAKQESCTYLVQFEPTESGTYQDDIIFKYNNGRSTVKLVKRLSGSADYNLAALSARINPSRNFGLVDVDTSKRHVVTVTNHGGVPATNIVISGLDYPYTQVGTCPSTLAPGTSCSFNVDFKPTEGGTFNDEIIIDYNNGKQTRKFTFPIVGRAKEKPAELMVNCESNFGNLTKGQHADRTCTITNIGKQTANTIVYNGFKSPPFYPGKGQGLCGPTLEAGETCNYYIRYKCLKDGVDNDKFTVRYRSGANKKLITVVRTIVGTCKAGPKPIDGGWTKWSGYVKHGGCVNGVQKYKSYRECTDPAPSHGGKECKKLNGQYDLIEYRYDKKECGNLGQWGTWSPWQKHGACKNDKQKYKRSRQCTPAGKLCKTASGQLATSETTYETRDQQCSTAKAVLKFQSCDSELKEGGQELCGIKNVGNCKATNLRLSVGAPFLYGQPASSACGQGGYLDKNVACNMKISCPKPLGSKAATSSITVKYNDCKGEQVLKKSVNCKADNPPVIPTWGSWTAWEGSACVNGKRKQYRWRMCLPNGQKCTRKDGSKGAKEDESRLINDPKCHVAAECTVEPSIGTALPPANVVQAEFSKRTGRPFHKMYLPQTGNQLTQASYSQWKQFIKFEKCKFPDGKIEWKVKDYVTPVNKCNAYMKNDKTVPCLLDKSGKCIKTWLDGINHGYSSCMYRVHNGGGLPPKAGTKVINGQKLHFCDLEACFGRNPASECTGTWGSWSDYGCNKKGYKAKWRKCPAGKTCWDAVKKQCTTSMDEHSTTEKCNSTAQCGGEWKPWSSWSCAKGGYFARWRKCEDGKKCLSEYSAPGTCRTTEDDHKTKRNMTCSPNVTCGFQKVNDKHVYIQAECYNEIKAAGGNEWKMINKSGASAGKALQALPDKGTLRNDKSNSPSMMYKIMFPSAGRWYVYVRGWGDADGSGKSRNKDNTNGEGKRDSVHVGINGNLSTAKAMDHFPANKWFASNDRRGTNAKAYIDVPSAGKHMVWVYMREDGFIIDRLDFKKP